MVFTRLDGCHDLHWQIKLSLILTPGCGKKLDETICR
jgi:hypothetical protein